MSLADLRAIHIPSTSRSPNTPSPYFSRNTHTQATSSDADSPLLRSIRRNLRAARGARDPSLQPVFYSPHADGRTGEEVLTWDISTVTLTQGSVLSKKWSFEDPIQWACIGWLYQSSLLNSHTPSTPAFYRENPSDKLPPEVDPDERPTFGAFARAQMDNKREDAQDERLKAVFIFIRGTAKIYMDNGLEFTLSLPFTVQRAWPVEPHGLFIQRVVEGWEIEELKDPEEDRMATIFTMTSPFAEPAAIGLTDGVKGGFASIPLEMKPDYASEPTPIPPEERILWVSQQAWKLTDKLFVTLNAELNRITIWRYVYAPPPPSSSKSNARPTTHAHHAKRSSMSGNTSAQLRQSNAAPDDLHVSPGRPDTKRPSNGPGLAPTLTTTTTMADLMGGMGGGAVSQSHWSLPFRFVRDSSGKVSIDHTGMDPPVNLDDVPDPAEEARMRSQFWAEKLYEETIPVAASADHVGITVTAWDERWDGRKTRSLLGICLRVTQTLLVYAIERRDDHTFSAQPVTQVPALAISTIRATRDLVADLLVLKPDGTLSLLTHGTCEIPLVFESDELPNSSPVVALAHPAYSSVSLHLADGSILRISLDLVARDHLVSDCLVMLSVFLPPEVFFALHRTFLSRWSAQKYSFILGVEFQVLESSLLHILGLEDGGAAVDSTADLDVWTQLATVESMAKFREDPVLKKLRFPKARSHDEHWTRPVVKRGRYIGAVLHALHLVAEEKRVFLPSIEGLPRITPLICRLALVVRPEWADYWKRYCPNAMPFWPDPKKTVPEYVDENLPPWPADMFSILYGRVNNPDWALPWLDSWDMGKSYHEGASFAFGRQETLTHLHALTAIYKALTDSKIPDARKRAEAGLQAMEQTGMTLNVLQNLALGVTAPLREALRTAQLSPGGDWSLPIYSLIGRNDLAEGFSSKPAIFVNHGYRSMRETLHPTTPRKTCRQLVEEVHRTVSKDHSKTTGVELDTEDFTRIRFGTDKRLDEIARMLCSSIVPHIRAIERPELNEAEQLREQQHQVLRMAERTLALPLGRAVFTFGSVPTVTKESFAIPKFEFSVRVQPGNLLIPADIGKIAPDWINWGEFHNGVAAGLRISTQAQSVESSWIKFNKPSELTPEHAGFLYALGLTGHLREMLTWHTFGYLTPKHEMTSIGVLLGLAAANVGNSNRHVTKLIAVHTPALLPTPDVDLNVPLITQSAGLMGVGLLYLGTKHRRMAEVCLSQISRRDLYQPDISNEYREAYTLSAALACGMVLLGKGSSIPADLAIQKRLRLLIHGEPRVMDNGKPVRPTFDVNLTSPAATVALALMYLRTERQDVADILTMPDTLEAINHIQPSFLMIRAMARAIIMWNTIQPTKVWLMGQLPNAIRAAMDERFRGQQIDDGFELAYYNILAGACFAIALKYAGTAREEAYLLLVQYYDMFSQLAYTNSLAYDQRIKRSAIREGLSLISISLTMVMAGTGEVNCLRRLRYAYGMYNHPIRYATHVATHMSIGLLFLGGGRYTLGTSDAAIACMVAAFYPRFSVSSDNKTYIQAYRHLWVLAVEPRCLVARDVDSREIVYVPVKIKIREKKELGNVSLIAPTLVPEVERLVSIRVDTPRYWPFYLDVANSQRHRDSLLRSQTLFVKRRTAFLSYIEDPKGSRSLFVRSGSSVGDAATLDFPRASDAKSHPANDLHEFIAFSSNDPLFLAFADRFCQGDGETPEERQFQSYCHAALLDSIVQDKPQTLQSHVSVFHLRAMSPDSAYFTLRLQDLRFAADFYSKIFDRRFSGRSENNPRPPLIRENTLLGTLYLLDAKLEPIRASNLLKSLLARYARGEGIPTQPEGSAEWVACLQLSWYLQRNSVPVASVLDVLRSLAHDAHGQLAALPPPHGTPNTAVLDQGLKELLHATGTQLSTTMGSGWTMRSLDEVIGAWSEGIPPA
ncbi:hypothetical protein C8Q80DRAFT_1272379 [Daedaleopsis nitida]|nr:hypothetical protein C8Q80DRAFT_1272379 [Daedaleopsis nitida]